jgi:hypothetical protein
MAGSINMPGALALGDLPTTTSVRFGRGGALSINNSGTAAAGQVAVAGTLRATDLNAGTSPMTCAAVIVSSSVTVGSGGQVHGSTTTPSIRFGSTNSISVGIYRPGTNIVGLAGPGSALFVGSTVSTATSPFTTNGNPFTCGALTCSSLSCTSIASAGDITQPRYSLRLFKNANQSTTNGAATAVVWNAAETSGGGSTNWAFTPGSTLLTCPKNGRYLITYQLMYAGGAASNRDTWVEINPPGGVPGSVRRHAELSSNSPGVSDSWVCGTYFTYQLSAGDTLMVVATQNSGGSLNLGFSGNQVSEFGAVRLDE